MYGCNYNTIEYTVCFLRQLNALCVNNVHIKCTSTADSTEPHCDLVLDIHICFGNAVCMALHEGAQTATTM